MPDEEYIDGLVKILASATGDSLYMVAFSSLFSVIIGGIMGVALYITAEGGIAPCKIFSRVLGFWVNVGRSIPFVIIIIAVFPLSKFIVGSSIGKTAAIVPLTIAAAPFMARLTEAAFSDVSKGVVEAAIGMGATPLQVIGKVLLPETAQSLIMAVTITVINLVGYSAMAGTMGGGGLGDAAIRYGYQRFRTDVLIITIIILVLIVQIIQAIGNFLAAKADKR